MNITKKNMPETMYRASRCCRVLGNPTAYLILRRLDIKRDTPGGLSKKLHIPISTVSMTLRHLRQLDLVRYETRGSTKEYWVKEKRVMEVLNLLERLVEEIREKKE